MSGVDDDDEWARAEVTLKPLNDQSKIRKPALPVSVPIILASNRYNASTNGPPYEANTGNNMNSNTSNYNQSNINNYYTPNNIIQVNPLPDDQIDSALVSAMSNPRERMQLFQIEDTILKFVKSNEKLLEFPPVHNSFRRLLAYRVGQRFGLSHSTTDSSIENGEKSITLFKTPFSAPPKTLLIDLNIPVDTTMNNSEDTLDYLNATQFIASHPVPIESVIATSAPAPAPAKKVQLMKRNVAKQSSEGAKVLVIKQQQTEEDREKAYNEARARIFGDGDIPSNLDGCSINPSNSSDKLSSSQSQKDLSSSAQSTSTSSNVSSGKQSSATSTGSKNNSSGKSASSQIQKSPSDNNFETTKSLSGGGVVRKVTSTSSLTFESNSVNTSQPTQAVSSKGSKSGSGRAEASTPTSTGSTDKDKSSNSNNDSPVDIAATSNTSGKNSRVSQASSNNNNNNNNNSNASNNADRAHTSIRKKAVDVGSWKGNKSQVRDLDAERSDPDFVRRSSPSLLISTTAQQQQQQQQQLQQGRQASMNVNNHMMSGIHMPHAGEGIIYMQNAQSSGQYMMQTSSNPAAGAPPAMYTNMPPQLDSNQMIYSNPHHSAVPMAHPYPAAIISNRPVSEGTYMAGDMSSNASSNAAGQPVAMHEYPQNIPAPGPLPNNAFYPQNGPIMLAPTLQQPMSIISAGPSAGQAGAAGVYYQQTAPGGGLPWPPQQHQHMNMVQMVSSGPYYSPHQSNHAQPYITSSSSADQQQQQQQQQQQFIQSQQAEMYSYNGGNGNPPNGGYYDYPPPSGYYQQPQTQLQGQQYDAANQASPTKAKKGQQRIFYNSEFPPLG